VGAETPFYGVLCLCKIAPSFPSSWFSSPPLTRLTSSCAVSEKRVVLRKYDQDYRLKAMTEAALKGVKKASADLDMPSRTLAQWCYDDYRKEYFELREKVLEEKKAFHAEQALNLAARNREAEALLHDELVLNVKNIDARDLPGAIRNHAVAAKIHTEEAAGLRGEANVSISVKYEAVDLLRAMKAKGQPLTKEQEHAIEGTATEITDEQS
jgi:hypothetical protein